MDRGQCTASSGDHYFPEQTVAVPFQWEASPGRPKSHVDFAASIYPLRPPPRFGVESPGSGLPRDVLTRQDVVGFQSLRAIAGLSIPFKNGLERRSQSFSHADSSNHATQQRESTGDGRRRRAGGSRATGSFATLPISDLGLTTWSNIDSPRLSYHVRLKLRDLLQSNAREDSTHNRRGSFSCEVDGQDSDDASKLISSTLSQRTNQLVVKASTRQPLSKNSPRLQLFLRKTEAEELVEALLRSTKKDQKRGEMEEFGADRKQQSFVYRKLKLLLLWCFSNTTTH